MNIRIVFLLACAVLTGLGSTFLARAWVSNQRHQIVAETQQEEAEPRTMRVLVADTNLNVGVFLNEGDVRWQEWPAELVLDQFVLDVPENADITEGAVVQHPFSEGEPINAAKLIKPNERGFLAALLKPGHRAISIPTDATQGVAGLVVPGDHVDLILTHSVGDGGGGGGGANPFADLQGLVGAGAAGGGGGSGQQVSETILSDMRVIAIDQSFINEGSGSSGGLFGGVNSTVTLEASPREAEKIAVALSIGQITLSLRSFAKTPEEAENEEVIENLGLASGSSGEVSPQAPQTYTLDRDVSVVIGKSEVGQSIESQTDETSSGESTSYNIEVFRGGSSGVEATGLIGATGLTEFGDLADSLPKDIK